jgi:hypothetical protein
MVVLMQLLKEFGTMLQVNFWFHFWADGGGPLLLNVASLFPCVLFL